MIHVAVIRQADLPDTPEAFGRLVKDHFLKRDLGGETCYVCRVHNSTPGYVHRRSRPLWPKGKGEISYDVIKTYGGPELLSWYKDSRRDGGPILYIGIPLRPSASALDY